MQFHVVADSPDASLHEQSLRARNELITKLLDCWERLSEVQLFCLPPGKSYERIPQSIDCELDDDDRYVPRIDDPHIDGDEQLLREQLEATKRERAQVAKQLADAAIQACREAFERFPRSRGFMARIMVYTTNGSVEAISEQKFSASALGELPPEGDEANEPDSEVTLTALDRLAATVERLVRISETTAEQLRTEKGDMHQRQMELLDKNMAMLDKFKELASAAMTHAQLPPEYYVLEGQKMRMRLDSQHAAMAENTRAAMAADRQKTIQKLSDDNPNALETLLAAAQTFVEHANGTGDAGSTSEGTAGPGDDSGATGPSVQDEPTKRSRTQREDKADEGPAYCRGTQRLRSIIDDATIDALSRNMHPDHWSVLAPLTECLDEGEFRRHMNAISAALSELEKEEQDAFRSSMRASIPVGKQVRLVGFLGSYGLRIS